MANVRVSGFLPSTNGFSFPNDWPHVPFLEFRVPTGQELKIGDAAGGLCGGMTFAVKDLFDHARQPPTQTAVPEKGTPLFQYLIKRAMDSFDIPAGPAKYYAWMALPDHDLAWVKGVRWRTLHQEWPAVKADLDAGRTSPLGLVRTRSYNPGDLGRNHQVLAFGYDLDEPAGTVRVHVYDPNHPGDDSVAIAGATSGSSAFSYVQGEDPVRGFFRSRFQASNPPAFS
ncbi:MAG TPA: hypothetical protein VGH10_11540 [Actinomycetota bacterium]